ncbi:MAG: DUF1570 domain-containing protein [Planctomycetes bacterium]|nr:DUF1570 domain-containing protein [Planctomycetota bacterium]
MRLETLGCRLGPIRGFCLLLATFVAVCLTIEASAGAEGWVDQRAYGPLVCHADFPLNGLEPLLGEIAQIQQELIRLLEIPPTNERIEILLFHDRSSYRRYLAQRFPNVPYRQALYVRSAGQGTVLAFQSDDLPVDLRHECTHAMLHAVLPMVPLWLDEGLAEYFEVPAADRLNGNPHHSTVKWWMRLGRVPSMATLEAKQSLDDMGRSEYRDSWAYVHFLLNGPPAARAELVAMLADIRSGTPPGQLSQRLGRLTPDLSGELVEHFKTFGQ